MINITAAGRLTRDAELKYFADGKAVLNFSVACDVGYGESKHPVYLGCSLFGKRAEALDPYLKKGMPVTVQGAGDLRKWDGDKGSGAEIKVNVNEVVMQGSKGDNQPSAQPSAPGGFRDDKPSDIPVGDPFADSEMPF